ncbi:threonine aldolase [Saccharothrix sp. NRRL B-16348]|uniref:threonine aldolase family protein n=1 Tax=Saccharothrix sp. NRRL B-16348 TaxID=1415542 RepID=UPI0006ADD2C0|nr:beta-eliminating lyase-related protein [Saccharothrix sp. NRRL B-16348]KOX24538.1 threonine aldolase [Saccharothrix sp. NRRL B-16348]
MTPEIRRSLVQHSRLRQDPHAVLRRLLDRVPPGLRLDEPAKQLEQRIADLLGKPAALFFPTGTMAQQTAMRVHAERTGRRTFAAHPQCHLVIWEDEGYSAVHGLRHLAVGDREDLITLDDLAGVREPIAALLLELPQREIGGLLPAWDDLVAQTKWARDGGAAAHMDGARLWEAQTYYDRPFAEIADLFDTVYVSLYKGLEGVRGAVLAGDQATIDAASVWRRRLGGATPDSWPAAVTALMGLDEVLPRMAEFRDHAVAVAAAINADGYATTRPRVPQTPLFHVHIPAPKDAVAAAAKRILAESGVELPQRPKSSPDPTRCSIELTIGVVSLDFTPQEVADLIRRLR